MWNFNSDFHNFMMTDSGVIISILSYFFLSKNKFSLSTLTKISVSNDIQVSS